ncbi:hypothetical protein WJX81_001784 [Elliptochloris bilobata]|uniref:Uncharacterized protein n=1 Tax=Elliptochloris bilobata TaxID=381761 RepID=A0AAW1QJ38_9CHLO
MAATAAGKRRRLAGGCCKDVEAVAAAAGAYWGLAGRPKRVPGGDPLHDASLRCLVAAIREDSTEFEAGGRVLRLKQYIAAGVGAAALDAIIDALSANSRVEALYIQNFERGFGDAQLRRLTAVLRQRRIWALNVGENFRVSPGAWREFADALPHTAVAYLYVSEHHFLGRPGLKNSMRDRIRINRLAAPLRDPEVVARINNMWWNPRNHNPAAAAAAAARGAAAGSDKPIMMRPVHPIVARRRAPRG